MESEQGKWKIMKTGEMFSICPDLIWETERGKKEYQLIKVVQRSHPKEDTGHAITTAIKIKYGHLYIYSLEVLVMKKLIILEADTTYKQTKIHVYT